MAPYLLIQISDIHLTLDGLLPPGVRPRDNLVAGLATLAKAGIQPDVFVLTGDLADKGDATCYQDLAAILAEASLASGASIVYLPGNHDVRRTFRSHLLGATGSSEPINQVCWRGGLRIVALDSTLPGEDLGVLSYETLDFLRAALATPAPDGTVLAMHHPPIRSPIEPMSRIRLIGSEQLRDAIRDSDIRLVLCGHNHHEALGMLGSIPVWVSPAASYRADLGSPQVFQRLSGSAFSRIDLDDQDVRVSVFPFSS